MKIPAYYSILCSLVVLASCTTQPAKETPQAPAEPPAISEPNGQPETETGETPAATTPDATDGDIVAQFENVTITKQTFITTKTELEAVVNDLNRITFSRDYNAWLEYLSPEYRANFSDPAVLAEVSANLPIKGIQLRSIKDYFNYVFVPSRQNMRVDDIKFVTPTRVYVIMEISPGNLAAIYIIEKFGNTWKLVPKNQ